MDIEINTTSSEAVYAQIVRQVREAVQAGAVTGGHSLPTVRQLAGDLMVNPNTVAKAYKMLEAQRIVRGAGRAGTFIEDNALVQLELSNNSDAKYELASVLKSLQHRGLNNAQLQQLLLDEVEKLAAEAQKTDERQISFKGDGFTSRFPRFLKRT